MSPRKRQVDQTPEDPEIRYAREQIHELSQATYGGAQLECDMVMKGGITSGVVYPLTICRVATCYRLVSIGGTSAGAIAAGVAAAAEYRRQTAPDASAGLGYQQLAKLPEDISKQLEDLFQARPETKRLFDVLNAAIDPRKHGVSRAIGVLGRVAAGKLWWFLGGFALTLALVVPGLVITNGLPIDPTGVWRILIGLMLPAFLALAVALVAALVGFAREAGRLLPATGFALTDGATHGSTPALTEWLANKLDELAGLDDATSCLTLAHLWGEKAVARWRRGSDVNWVNAAPIGRARGSRRIDLEVMTTDLTLRRPFRLPFSTQAFMFSKAEWSCLFPERVVAIMARDEFLTEHRHPETGELLHAFPGAGSERDAKRPGPDSLPVIVMVRMSLSFPGLISAVPLYAVDFNGDQSVVRHWFSDGGISSNFPMHLFDVLLPTRPTFGVDLSSPHPLHLAETVWRPPATTGGIIPRARPFSSLGGFLGALRDTMQNWADNKQVTQRGYADRVVEIRLAGDEGGMNLRMSPTRVLKLAARGALAGESLLQFDWDAHRVMRYRTAMARLSDILDQVRSAWRSDLGDLYPGHVASYPRRGKPASSYLGGQSWSNKDSAATEALVAVVEGWERDAWPAIAAPWPLPAPQIRTVPE